MAARAGLVAAHGALAGGQSILNFRSPADLALEQSAKNILHYFRRHSGLNTRLLDEVNEGLAECGRIDCLRRRSETKRSKNKLGETHVENNSNDGKLTRGDKLRESLDLKSALLASKDFSS